MEKETYAIYFKHSRKFHYVINGDEITTKEKAKERLLFDGIGNNRVDGYLEFLENVNFKVR